MKKILLFLSIICLVFTSCGENKNNQSVVENKTEEKEQERKRERENSQKEIEQLHFFLDNNNREVTDEYGISYELKVIKTIVGQKEMFNSGKMYVTRGDIGYDKYVVVSSYRIKTLFELKTNGKSINNIELDGFLVKSQLNVMLRSGDCNDSFTYYPSINTTEDRKASIKKFTGAWCSFGIGNEVKNAKIEALTSCGILDDSLNHTQYETINLLDLDNIYKVIYPKQVTLKNEEREEVSNNSKNKTNLIITVDNLRVRTTPSLDGEKIENLTIDSEVEFIEKSDNTSTVTINDKEVTEYWYKVKTSSGNIGWIHGCCFNK